MRGMKAFFTGLVVAIVIAGGVAALYGAFGISAAGVLLDPCGAAHGLTPQLTDSAGGSWS